MCAFDAVCPAGKGAAKWRAGYGRVAEKSGSSKRFAHQGALPARRGRRSPFAPFSMKGTAALSSAYERRMVHRPASSAAALGTGRAALAHALQAERDKRSVFRTVRSVTEASAPARAMRKRGRLSLCGFL